jgi:hypothetical protein
MSGLSFRNQAVSRKSSACPSLASVGNYPDEFELETLLKEDGLQGLNDSFDDDDVSMNFEDESDVACLSGSQVSLGIVS